ncbi:hypothetical protein DM01DRAFT_1407747 [Hesseltinella vesiculosa]|uniref:C2 domain-containing protein n=1 Tax=Hesseltinella vesiculosa TaxID=101127 RepID=A0A1X2GH69_9FUNG|nr:hypothetical protein DM01DRAFT_1407747 [Hesseltinella vesiculosa]
MTLLLTKSCDYALLVAIEEGKGFPNDEDKDVFIHSRLDLPLPEPMEDLIPPPTLITTQPINLDSSPQWHTTLVYFISSKILKRLQQHQSSVNMQLLTISVDGETDEIGKLILPLNDAKVVLMKDGKRPLSYVKDYVVDKGSWQPVNHRAQLKVGLFIVDMPPPAGERNNRNIAMPNAPPNSNLCTNDQGLELQSADDVWNQLASCPTPSLNNTSQQASYLQIGQGSDRHTFVLRIKEALVPSTMLRPTPAPIHSDKPKAKEERRWVEYSFAQWHIRHLVNDQWQVTDPPMCLALKGHQQDIHEWLAEQDVVEVNLWAQQGRNTEQIIGKARIELRGWQLKVIEQASFPLHDRGNRLHVQPDYQFAKITVQLGLTNGWTDDDES